jgi:transcription-repair coupling factor (superfamily II helicase)
MWIDYISSKAGLDPAIKEIREGFESVVVKEHAWALYLFELAVVMRDRPIVAVFPTEKLSSQIFYDLEVLSMGHINVYELVPWETLPFERISPTAQVMGKRLKALSALISSSTSSSSSSDYTKPTVIISSIKSVSQKLPPNIEERTQLKIVVGQDIDLDFLKDYLVDVGYSRVYQVEAHGEFAVRGSIVDIFVPNCDLGVRLDLSYNTVESIRLFDIDDQRTQSIANDVEIVGCREFVLTEDIKKAAADLVKVHPKLDQTLNKIAEGQYFSGIESWMPLLCPEKVVTDLLDDKSMIIYFNADACIQKSHELINDEKEIVESLTQTWDLDFNEFTEGSFPALSVSFERLNKNCKSQISKIYPFANDELTASFDSKSLDLSGSIFDVIYDQIRRLLEQDFKIIIFCTTSFTRDKIISNLKSQNINVSSTVELELYKSAVSVVTANLEKSVVVLSQKLALISEFEISHKRTVHRPTRHRKKITTGFFDELTEGSYVVHSHHGIARYGGMVKRSIDEIERDYLLLEYKGKDRLYLPVDMMYLLTPYSGGESPSLSRLGGTDWEKTTSKVKAEIAKVAVELVELYKARSVAKGFCYSQNNSFMDEFVDSTFSYVETSDQKKAIEDVFSDMEIDRPMDRLICGDVGFGKTEVAIRAIFKALNDSKQVALLAPTTILANQHFNTLKDRFKNYPFKVALLSRFITQAQANDVVDGLKSGQIDVVVGTHKLLGQRVNFKDLGLIVVDEEQRFGVSHKEKLKKLQIGVDVLTLSASPIPRTLEMSLTGIKEMSLITTPPVARMPILTFVGIYDKKAVSEAIRRELLREGQVFYVFNRVNGIENKVDELKELVPQANVRFAHGRMSEDELEKTIIDFIDQKFDVLVCTTIIESGIDMPNVNTLIVERSDQLGLGQLHQLRGRVGRSNKKAYAYLFYPENKKLTDTAYERLKSISEQTELGAGFRLAMRDLEIRGAGTLLGNSQSGHIAAVGYDLYVQMVSDAVKTIKGVREIEKPKVTIDLPAKAFIPKEYIEQEDIRLDMYKRLSSLNAPDEAADLKKELIDRFSNMPKECETLFELVELRLFCLEKSILEVFTKQKPNLYSKPTFELTIAPIKLASSRLIRLERFKIKYRYESEVLKLELNTMEKYLLELLDRSKSEKSLAAEPTLVKKVTLFMKSLFED